MPGIGPAPEVSSGAFQLKDGAVSKGLQSPRGPVYMTVTGKRDPYVPKLDEVKDRVREDVVKIRAAELSKQKAGEIASALRSAKDFAAAAKAQGLEAKDTQLIARGSPRRNPVTGATSAAIACRCAAFISTPHEAKADEERPSSVSAS